MRANIPWKRAAMVTVLLLAACGGDKKTAPAPVASTVSTRQDLQVGSRRHGNHRGASVAQVRIGRSAGRHSTGGPGGTDQQ